MKRAGRAVLRRAGPALARWLAHSWRVEVVRPERGLAILDSGRPYLLLTWHEALLPVLWHHRGRGIAAVVSEAQDGEYLAALAAPLGYRLIRGSSSRSARHALRESLRAMQRGIPVGVTPDGPRGPPRALKPALVVAAARAGVAILPVFAGARRAWRAGSWDGFLVPVPGTTVRIAYGEPVMGLGMSAQVVADRVLASLEDAIRLAAWPDAAATATA